MITEEITLKEASLTFINDIDKVLNNLPVNEFPGRYIWTPYSPTNDIMRSVALKHNRSEYFGLTVNDVYIKELERLVDTLTTEMISYIEDNNLVRNNFLHNKSLTNIRFLTNRDFSNKPVMWFNGMNKFYSVFLNPGILIPKKKS